MTREDKVAIVAYLEAKGAFLIRYSVERAERVNEFETSGARV